MTEDSFSKSIIFLYRLKKTISCLTDKWPNIAQTYNISHCSINLLVLNIFTLIDSKRERGRPGNRKTEKAIFWRKGTLLQNATSTKSNTLPHFLDMKSSNQKGYRQTDFSTFLQINETLITFVCNHPNVNY